MEAGRTLLVEREKALKLADDHNITVVAKLKHCIKQKGHGCGHGSFLLNLEQKFDCLSRIFCGTIALI